MGFDVTFHPIAREDLEHFLFDVVEKPALASARAAELAADESERSFIEEGIYAKLPEWMSEPAEVAQTFAFAAAALAGYRHPYWYARNSAVTFLLEEIARPPRLFVPVTELAKGLLATYHDASGGLIAGNYSASGVIPPESLPELERLLAEHADGAVEETFDEEGLDSLRRAIRYAAERRLGLIEACDLVVPMADESYTRVANLRAHFLCRLDPDGGPRKKAGPKQEAAPRKKPAPEKKPAPRKPAPRKAVPRKAVPTKKPAPKKAVPKKVVPKKNSAPKKAVPKKAAPKRKPAPRK